MAKRKAGREPVSGKALEAPADSEEMSYLEERFVERYVQNGNNGTDAYYMTFNVTRNSARALAPLLLAKVSIQRGIEKRKQELSSALKWDLQRHVGGLVAIATASRDEFIDVMEDPQKKENYRGLGDKRLAISKTKSTEHYSEGELSKIVHELELQPKAWAYEQLQTIFQFQAKPDSEDSDADDAGVLGLLERVLKRKAKKTSGMG